MTPVSATAIRPPAADAGGGDFVTQPPVERGDWGGRPADDRVVQRYLLGTWVGIGGILMFFAALTSAMIVRHGLASDWQPFAVPPVLYVSTLVLALSSATVAKARGELLSGNLAGLRRWINFSACLGLAFLAGQLLGWQQLAGRGIYLASNPASSFYYLLTAGHGLHLLGGIAVLGYIWARVRGIRPWPTRRAAVEAMALYWHFMDVLWIYILGLLLFWR